MEDNKELMETVEDEEIETYEWDSTDDEEEEDGSVALGTGILVGLGALIGIAGSWAYRKVKPKVKERIDSAKAKKSKKSKSKEAEIIDIDTVAESDK